MKRFGIFKTKWIVAVGIVLLLPLLWGCHEDALPEKIRILDDVYAFIVGEWEWTKSLVINSGQGNTLDQIPESGGVAKQYISSGTAPCNISKMVPFCGINFYDLIFSHFGIPQNRCASIFNLESRQANPMRYPGIIGFLISSRKKAYLWSSIFSVISFI